MSLIKGLQRRRATVIALVSAFVIVGVAVASHMSNLPSEASLKADKQRSQARLRRGVGSEVRFASAVSKPEQIDEALGSASDFIYRRSGLRMSGETKQRLATAESNVLRGKTKHITLGELTDNLTTAIADRLATLTDEEIEHAAEISSDENGEIRSRADGKWGVVTRKQFIQQVQSSREWGEQDGSALRSALRALIEGEVNERESALGAALPEQFGQVGTRGFTPAQALLITYSVAADDPLTDSQSDIERMIVQKRMSNGMTREQRKAQKNVSGRPYGPGGVEHPSAAHLFLKAAVDNLLNRSEGGEK
jgi:hypothetical protein